MSQVAFVTLRYRDRAGAPEHREAHLAWLRDGLQRGIVLVAGSLDDDAGGGLLVRCRDAAALRRFVAADPFVEHGVVEASVAGVAPRFAAPELTWIVDDDRDG